MRSSTNSIKALAQRFVSLPPLMRMKLTKKLLELYSSDQTAREDEQPTDGRSPAQRKSFLEQFWDEVEEAHGDHLHKVNPFREERRSKLRIKAETEEQDGYLTWRINQSNMLPLF